MNRMNSLFLRLLLLCALVLHKVLAENRVIQKLNVEVPNSSTSQPIVSLIHGSGYLQFSELIFSTDEVHDSDLFFDVVVSTLPDSASNSNGIDDSVNQQTAMYQAMGIGAFGGNQYYTCCTLEAVEANVCTAAGTLIISNLEAVNTDVLLSIPAGSLVHNASLAMMGVLSFGFTTHVALIIANCAGETTNIVGGANLMVQGDLIWLSYVATNNLPYLISLALAHIGLMLWFRYRMNVHKESRIQVEDWIFVVLVLASVAAVVCTIEEATEAISDGEILWVRMVSDFTVGLAHVVSRCLYVAVSMGLGVTKTSLSFVTKCTIVGLGLAVLLLQTFANGMDDLWFSNRDNDSLSAKNQEQEEDSIQLWFYFNMIFVIWIPVALQTTIRQLRGAADDDSASPKLERYRWLWKIFLLAMVLTFVMVVLFFVDMVQDGGKLFDLETFAEGNRLIYLLILACISVLWRPNPQAPMYGYVMLTDGEDEGDGVIKESYSTFATLEMAEMPGKDDPWDHDLALEEEDNNDEDVAAHSSVHGLS